MRRALTVIFMPWRRFFREQRPIAGFFCLLLQLSLQFWPIAILWSLMARPPTPLTPELRLEQRLVRRVGWAAFFGALLGSSFNQ